MSVTISVDLTPAEIQTLTAAMAGNFPSSLNQHRIGVLRKLAKAQSEIVPAIDAKNKATTRRLRSQGLA